MVQYVSHHTSTGMGPKYYTVISKLIRRKEGRRQKERGGGIRETAQVMSWLGLAAILAISLTGASDGIRVSLKQPSGRSNARWGRWSADLDAKADVVAAFSARAEAYLKNAAVNNSEIIGDVVRVAHGVANPIRANAENGSVWRSCTSCPTRKHHHVHLYTSPRCHQSRK